MRQNRAPLAAALGCLALGASCAVGPDAETALPTFPAEKLPHDFPGVSYPRFEGAPPRLAGAAPVWLVALDGATWDRILPLVRTGELPAFARLIEEGAHGILRSEEPTISPALWATVATGLPRFAHGVENFLVKLPGSYEAVPAGPLDRKAPALWDYVGHAGGRSAVVGWFGSYPAEEIAGCYVSEGFDPAAPDPRRVHPDDLAERLAAAPPSEPNPEERSAIGRTALLERTLRDDARRLGVLKALVSAERPDLAVLYLSGIDVAQHLAWRHMEPASQQFPQDGPPDPALAAVIPAYYRFADRALGELLELAPAEATLVVVSDHGAGPMQPAEAFHFQLEVLLEALGLVRPAGPAFAIDELYRHDKRIWLDLEGVESEGRVPIDRVVVEADALRARLAALRTQDGAPLFERVDDLTTEDAWQVGEPALAVRFAPAALLATHAIDGERRVDMSPVRLRHTDVSGAHRPDGIVLLRGPGVRRGALSEPASLYHVAPTVLHLLGLPQDGSMLRHAPRNGGVLTAAFEPAGLALRPVRMLADHGLAPRTGRVRRPDAPNPAGDEALAKLRALGYLR